VPGTELPTSPGSAVYWDARTHLSGLRVWQYTAPIVPGVQVDADTCYWVSIMGAGRPDCTVHWNESRDGNNYRVRDDDSNWGYEDIRLSDYAFCVDLGIVPATTPWVDGGCGDLDVACCHRNRTCSDGLLSDCAAEGGVFFPTGTGYPFESCDDVTCPVPLNDDCENAKRICENVCTHPTNSLLSSRWSCEVTADCPSPDVCAPWAPDLDNGYCVNLDLLDDGPVCSRSALDCYDSSQCQPYPDHEIYRCYANTDNRLATTDGPSAGAACFSSGENSFQADVWNKLVSPCNGILVVDECRSQLTYDGMLSVHGNHTANYDLTACPITTNDDLLMCNDDFCPGSATVSGVQAHVVDGAVYLLRIGGWAGGGTLESADQGRATMNIGFICPATVPAFPPTLPANARHWYAKNRYLSMNLANNANNPVAYEVTVAQMYRCSNDEGRACVTNADCLAGGTCIAHADVGSVVGYIGLPVNPNGACDPGLHACCHPNDDCGGEFFADVISTPWFRVWTEDTVHLTGCEIIPAVVYEIRAIDLATGGPSVPLTIGTIPKPDLQYGDCVGEVAGGQFTPPQGVVNVTDLQAYLISNKGGFGGTAPVHTTWVDLHGLSLDICPSGTCVIPQQILNVSDMQLIRFGMQGDKYVDTPGQENPGNCPP